MHNPEQTIKRVNELSRKGYTNQEIALSLRLSESAVRELLAGNTAIVMRTTQPNERNNMADRKADLAQILPAKHKFAMAMVSAAAGFAGSHLAEKAYKKIYLHKHKIVSFVAE